MDVQKAKNLKGEILIVDDYPENLLLLCAFLQEQGYQIHSVTSGEQALKQTRNLTLDLILLDIRLPDLNGYEVCSQLKKNPLTRDIPVIFLSGLDEAIDKVKAFQVGGVDYISKPFQLLEVTARVENQLNLTRLKQQIVDQKEILVTLNQELETKVKERTLDLQKTNSQLLQLKEELRQVLAKEKEISSFKSHIIRTIEHEFLNPLTKIFSSANLLQHSYNRLKKQQREQVFLRLQEAVREIKFLFEQIIFVNLKDLETIKYPCSSFDLVLFCNQITAELNTKNKLQQSINFSCNKKVIQTRWNEKILRQILKNLLENALKYSPKNSVVNFQLLEEEARIKFIIEDRGIGIPVSDRDRLYEQFYRGSNVDNLRGTGLGLTIVKQGVDLYGGTIDFVSEVERGTTFTIALPLILK